MLRCNPRDNRSHVYKQRRRLRQAEGGSEAMIYKHSQFSSDLWSPEYVPEYVRVRDRVSVRVKVSVRIKVSVSGTGLQLRKSQNEQ